jgi:RNA polymerase sigma-70 factor (ECF subfamily)
MTTLMGGSAVGLADRHPSEGEGDGAHRVGVDLTAIDLTDLAKGHRLGIWRYLRFLGCDDAAADDLTQETFLAVARGTANGGPVRDVTAYLRGVARNLFIKHLRRSRREPPVEELDIAQAAEAEEIWRQFAGDDGGESWLAALRECVDRLTGRGRQAIDLCYRDELSREQIARRLDMTPDGVKTLLRRTRQLLRGCVERKVRSEE